MPKKFWSTLFILLLGVGLLGLAATRLGPVNALRGDYELENTDPFANSEEAVELRIPMVALSAFRTLAIDYLWIRADELQMEGQYFDSLHMARLICKLQPQLPSVWEFQAWNMAYNISVAMPIPEERWEWVRAGFELLRDEGLKFNPESYKIHHYLAWIFQHKIGGITDDHHRYYKRRMAEELSPYLTPIYVPMMYKGIYEDIEVMAQMPNDWAKILANPKVAQLVEKIKQVEPKFTSDKKMRDGLFSLRLKPGEFSAELKTLIGANIENPAFQIVDWFIRAEALKRDWNLDPALMHKINFAYGPKDFSNESKHYSLDWRTPYVHAIYWAMHGLQFSEGELSFDTLKLKRVVYHSLQDLYYYGNLQVLPIQTHVSQRKKGQELIDAPEEIGLMVFNSQDLRMFPIAYQATLDLLLSYTSRGEKIPGGVGHGSANLCRSGIESLYLAGHVDHAQRYYNHLKKIAPDNKDYQQPLVDFVRMEMREEIQNISPKNAANYMLDYLRRSYASFAVGDDDNSYLYEAYATQVHEEFLKQFPDEEDRINRTSLRPFDEMRWRALMDFLNDQMVNPAIKNTFLG
ncbi:MAG: hypothetical protein K9M57_09415, partial [Phycisphaerae bacterium]|nr:hypothetical protein [Phycisphaerae bacterium]